MSEKFSIIGDFKDFFDNNMSGETFDEKTFADFLTENFITVPKKDHVSFIMDALKEFYDKNLKADELDVKSFMNFMEPKFTAAGYRQGFNPNPTERKKGNILILTEVGLGDLIISTGAIREIRRIYFEAHITLVAHRDSFIFAKLCPYVDEVISTDNYNSIDEKFIDQFPNIYELCMKTASKLLARRFDVCFSFSTRAYTDLLMYMSGARIRLASIYYKTLAKLDATKNTHRLLRQVKLLATQPVPYGDSHCHMADRFFSLVEEILHVPILNRKLEVWCTAKDISAAKEILKNVSNPFYALSMGGTLARKHYPPEKYARLLEMIAAEEPSAHFVILGGGNEDLKSAEIIKATSPDLYDKRTTDLTNKLTYRQSAAVLSFCKMLIANDTGTGHIAAGLGCPVLSPNCFSANFKMSNNDTPPRWIPYGVPCVVVLPEHALPECQDEPHSIYGCRLEDTPHCITQIEPETLLKGFHLLKERASKKINEPIYIH